jgi:hypothetical protein
MRYCGNEWWSYTGADENTTWSMYFAFWIIKATDTKSKYLIFIAFPPQQ